MARRSTAKSSGPPAFTGAERVVVFHGKQDFLRTYYLQQLRAAIESKTGSEVETVRCDGKTASLSDVFDELRSFGLMQQHRMIVVDAADEFVKNHREAVTRYVDSPEDTATLVLRADKWNKGNIDKAIEKVGQFVKCDPPSEADTMKWTVAYCKKKYSVAIEPNAARTLLEHVGVDLGRIDSELAKLAAGVPAGGSITAEQVDVLVGRASDEAAWAIQEAVLSGNAAAAMTKLHELTDLAKQADVLVGYFVADLMRKLCQATAMLAAGQGDASICGTLKMWGDRSRPFMSAARRLGPHRAAKLFDQIVSLDQRAKSGFGDPTRNLERFVVQFADTIK
ncbi:MAG: DNA polymerase III subunit delta [Planctomycetes bacterium]|nr:DNA polymerase III subunit delta [Planctomycetota bacterium]